MKFDLLHLFLLLFCIYLVCFSNNKTHVCLSENKNKQLEKQLANITLSNMY